MKTRTLLSLLLLWVSIAGYSQAGRLFTADAELSNSLVNQVFQDSNGIVWIATEDGLNRYDGSKFTIFKRNEQDPNSLLNNYVRTIYEDSHGQLFIGMFNGLQTYDDATGTFRKIPMHLAIKQEFGAHVITILQRRNGEYLVGTGGQGLFKLTLEDGAYRADQVTGLIPSNVINRLFEDKSGNLWAASEANGLYCLTPDNKLLHYPTATGGQSLNSISSICQDSTGVMYVGSILSGLFRYDSTTRSFEHIPYPGNPNLPVKSLLINDTHEILVGTDGAGMKSYTPGEPAIGESNLNVTMFDFSKAKIHSILKDRSGNTWIGIFQRGVMMIAERANNFGYIGYKSVRTNSIGSNCIMSLFQDHEGTLWVGTDSDGLYGIDPDGKAKVHYTPSADKSSVPSIILCIYEDSNRDLWLGSYLNGLFRLNRQTGKCEYIPMQDEYGQPVQHIYSLVEDSEKRLWIGTMGPGLYSIDLRTKAVKQYNYHLPNEQLIHNRWINTLLLSRDNKLYFGTYDGIGCLDLKTNSFSSAYNGKWVFAERLVVYTLYEDAAGNIWAGSSDGLLHFNTQTRQTTRYTMQDGLPNEVICAIRSDRTGNLWMTTSYGLSHMNVASKTFTNYYTNDGLQGNEFSKNAFCIDPTGRFYCGGINGITFFNPQEITYQQKKLDMRITGFYTHDRSVSKGMKSGSHTIIDTSVLHADKFRLAHKDNSFSIEFATLEFSNPEQITYVYSINEGNWVRMQPGANRLTFSDLSPGTYHFLVKACSPGTESEIRNFSVLISPAWYASGWAYLVYFLIAVVIVLLVVQHIRQRLQARQRLQEHLHAKEINEAKLQFFINISHEIRTPLSLIINPLRKLMAIDKDAERQNTYRTIHRNMDRILQLINQLLDIRKIDKGQMLLKYREVELITFLKDISSLFDDQLNAKQITLQVHHTLEQLPVWVDPKNFDKILMNVVSNAVKFTPQGGAIDIYLQTAKEADGRSYLEIIVSDNGPGINEGEIELIFERFYQSRTQPGHMEGTGVGLHLTRSLIELHQGSIRAENNAEGAGCRFIIRLPLGKEHLRPEEIDEEPLPGDEPKQLPTLPVEAFVEENDKIRSKSKRYVLVVDDDKEIRNYICRELASQYHTIECANGKEALAQMLKKAPDLVISDVMMPEMDGITLCRKIRQNVTINHVPVILLTAKTKEEDNLEGLETGADAYLSKPFSIDILRQTAQTIIRNREMLRNTFSGKQQQKDKMKTIHIKSADDKLIEKVMKLINENIDNPALNVEMLASRIGISRVHLHRKLKELTNQSTRDFIRNIRLQQAAALLSTKSLSITEVATATGFSNLTYFSNAFKELFGMSPMAYMEVHLKKGQQPEEPYSNNK